MCAKLPQCQFSQSQSASMHQWDLRQLSARDPDMQCSAWYGNRSMEYDGAMSNEFHMEKCHLLGLVASNNLSTVVDDTLVPRPVALAATVAPSTSTSTVLYRNTGSFWVVSLVV